MEALALIEDKPCVRLVPTWVPILLAASPAPIAAVVRLSVKAVPRLVPRVDTAVVACVEAWSTALVSAHFVNSGRRLCGSVRY